MSDLELIMRAAVSRRAMIARLGIAGLGAAALPVLAGCEGGSSSTFNPTTGTGTTTGTTTTPGPTFVDPVNFPNVPGRNINETVLNFAYLAEIIEADLYRQALNLASGRQNTAPLDATIPAPNSTAGYSLAISAGNLTSASAQAGFLYLVQYSYVEAAHRDFLNQTLVNLGAPRVMPNPNGYTANFGAPATLQSILTTIYAVEEVGARAYLGAAPFFGFNSAEEKNLVRTAVAIHATEARHSEALRAVLGFPLDVVLQYMGGDVNVVNNSESPNPNASADTFQYFLRPASVVAALQGFNR